MRAILLLGIAGVVLASVAVAKDKPKDVPASPPDVVRVGKDPWPSQCRPYAGQVTVIRGATIYDGAGRRIDNDMIRLEVGKRADIVLWDGDPLELMSSPVAGWIDVAAQPMTSRQTLLAQRYKALGRTDLPLQYPQ